MTTQILNQAKLKELLDYNPDTGDFTNKVMRSLRAMPGQIAGNLTPRGYIDIVIFGKKYKAHRLAWFYVYGVWPTNNIDHINRSKIDNRIANLRDITQAQNGQNKTIHTNNSSGHTGVMWHKATQRWRARIHVSGKEIYLGQFNDIQSATDARKQAEAKYHPYKAY
jgi:hypothetical protein